MNITKTLRAEGGTELSGYVALWAAKFVLHAKEFKNKNPAKPRIHIGTPIKSIMQYSPADQAEFWLFIDDSSHTGSLQWICDIFNLDIDTVRESVLPDWEERYANHYSNRSTTPVGGSSVFSR